MDIQTRKIEFVQEFLKLDDEKIISRLEHLIRKERKTADIFVPMSIDELHQRIETSMKDSKNEKITETDDLIAEIEKWR